jgi:hypothetical protein
VPLCPSPLSPAASPLPLPPALHHAPAAPFFDEEDEALANMEFARPRKISKSMSMNQLAGLEAGSGAGPGGAAAGPGGSPGGSGRPPCEWWLARLAVALRLLLLPLHRNCHSLECSLLCVFPQLFADCLPGLLCLLRLLCSLQCHPRWAGMPLSSWALWASPSGAPTLSGEGVGRAVCVM